MTIEEAINTAIEFEIQVRDLYRGVMEDTGDPVGKRIFRILADEEQSHYDYLRGKLDEWKRTGAITVERLNTEIPSQELIREEAGKLGARVAGKDLGGELEMLSRAYDVETETSNFYKKMVRELQPEGRQLFANFVEVEEGHLAIVRAEMDYLSRTGYWFDFKEFDME